MAMQNFNTAANKKQEALISREHIVQIAQSLAGHVDLRTAVEAVSLELAKVIPHDHIDAAMCTEDNAELIVYETGIQTSWGDERRKAADSPIRDILSGKKSSMIFEDALHDPRVAFDGSDTQPIREFGLRARIHTKLEITGHIIGALSLSSKQPGVFRQHHVHALRIVANVVGPYFYALQVSEVARQKTLAHAQELALRKGTEHLTDLQEQERVRIGMDLHDQVLADLSRLVLKLDDNTLSDSQKLMTARTALNEAIQDVRNIVEDARPTLLEMFGLGTAIEAFLARAVEGRSIHGRMAIDASILDELFVETSKRKLTLFRIAQEAINNAVSHSGATQVHVEAEKTTSSLQLRIIDNGCGFELGRDVPQGGLRNMSVRAALLPAVVQFNAALNGTGTCVTVKVPYTEAKHD